MTEATPELPPPAAPYVPPAPYAPVPGQPYYHPTYGWVTPPSSTNGLAIASLVLSLLWLAGIGSLLAVIFGHVSRGQIKRRPEKGSGLALAGLIIGYIGLVLTIAIGVAAAVIWNDPGVRNRLVRDDLRNAADAEQTFLAENGTYTNDAGALSDAGFLAWPGETISVAYNGNRGFCVVGARDGANDWYLYDSKAGGLADFKYSSEVAAKHACAVSGLNSYQEVD